MLYLASTSPRRSQLLGSAGIEFRLVEPGPEVTGEGAPAERARQRAASKARGAIVTGPDGWVLGVDTVVELAGDELGKPADQGQARQYLERLAGEEHRVHTALCLVGHPSRTEFEDAACARVRCRALGGSELDRYLATGTWRGKAGAYGLQDTACDFMEVVEGEPDTVVGLPLATLLGLWTQIGGTERC